MTCRAARAVQRNALPFSNAHWASAAATLTLYARWTPAEYTITYKDKGNEAFSGTHGTNAPQKHTYGTPTALVTPAKNGYTFGGWYAAADCSGTALTVLPAKGYTANITLYAKWTLNNVSDYTPATVTVYNDPLQTNATIWLSGSGLAANDRLVTKQNPQGSAFTMMRTVAGKNEMVATYDISLQSGKKSTGSAMSLTFTSAQHAGQVFTLVHQKADGTYEYFYAVADASGKLVFNGIYSLSPFMLVKGRLAQTVFTSLTDMPKTGDSAQSVLWAGLALTMAAASLACVTLRRRRRD